MKQYVKREELSLKVYNTIKQHKLIQDGEGIVVGISGGPDSVCLLHLLHSLSDELKIRLFAVHINHMLRGEESEADEHYVRRFCAELGIPLFVDREDVKGLSLKKGISLEEAGRQVRYDRFSRYVEKTGASKIAVAHNRNDQAETVLMNLMRGCGIDGLKGMEYCSGRIIRPLLDIGRDDIEAYCREYSLDPRTDSSNLTGVYMRNRVRLELIPYMEKLYGCDIIESINRMTLLLKDDSHFLEASAADSFNKCIAGCGDGTVILSISEITGLHPALQKRVVRLAIKAVKGNLKEIESSHVESILEICSRGKTGAQVCLPAGLAAVRSYGMLKLQRAESGKETPDFDVPLTVPGTTYVKEIGMSVDTRIEKRPESVEDFYNIGYNSLVQFLDYDKLNGGINIRNRRNGDVFKPYKSTGTKKLKEYFIDKKIPRDERRRIPLIAAGNEVVWVVGHKISDKFKVTENTKRVLRIECGNFVVF